MKTLPVGSPPSAALGTSSVKEDIRAVMTSGRAGREQRWGILEASRQISEVRSLLHARSKRTQESALPPLNPEPKKAVAETRTLDDLLREEMQ